jgi:hypothetical protein
MPNEFAQAGVDWAGNGGGQVFFTRLHVRYGRDKFPQDLAFQVTPNTEHFQARYILTHPATGDLSCNAGQDYLEELFYRRTREMDELYALTGWDLTNERNYMNEVKGRMTPTRRNGLEVPYIPTGGPGPGGDGPNGRTVLLLGLLALLIGSYLMRRRTTVSLE